MLSLTTGKPIAKFVDTDIYDGEVLYINDKFENDKAITKKYDDDDIDEYIKHYKIKGRKALIDMNKIKKALERNVEPLEDNYKRAYDELKKKQNDNLGKEIKVNAGYLQVIPDPYKREVVYVAGASGSGKSYFTSNYARQYKKLFPDKNIIVFSKLNDDEVIDKLNPIRIEIDVDLIQNPITMEELKDSLVIFDDTDVISDKKLLDAVNAIKNDCLEIGRHYNIYTVITSHLINDYKKTRTILNEAHRIVMYPASGSFYSISYVLKHYCGFSPKDVKKIQKLNSRWVCVGRHFPVNVIYEKGCYLLSKDNEEEKVINKK